MIRSFSLRLAAPARCAASIATALVVLAAGAVTAEAATFTPSGSAEIYTVPEGVTGLSVHAVGGPGGNGAWTPGIGGSFMALGAPGGTVRAQIAVTPGERLIIFVGRGGGSASGMSAGGGGAGGDFTGGDGGVGVLSDAGGGGGGATTIIRERDGAVLLVAGGGGGGGGDGVNGPGLGSYVGGHGGAGGIGPQPGGGGTGNQSTGAGGGGGADINYRHGGKGGLGAGTTGGGGGGGGGRWAGHGGDAGSVVVNVGIISQGGGGGGGGANYVIDGTRAVTHGVDNQSAGAHGSLQLSPAAATTTSISVEDPDNMGPNNRGIQFTANVTNPGSGGSVAFTATNHRGEAMTFCGAAPVNADGVATCAPTLGSGGYVVRATFNGSYASAPSSSGTIQKDIGRATATSFVGNPPPSAPTLSTVTVTVRVDGAASNGRVRWSNTGPTTNCPGTVSHNGSYWATSCTFNMVSTNGFAQNITARYEGTSTADVTQRTAPSSAVHTIVAAAPRMLTRNTLVSPASTRIPLGQSVSFHACYQGTPNSPVGADFCPTPQYGSWIRATMANTYCSAYWSGLSPYKYVYTCTPTTLGRHVFHSEYRPVQPSQDTRGYCDGASIFTGPTTMPNCAGQWYWPSADTVVTVYGPAHHLALTTNNPVPSELEPFQMGARAVQDAADTDLVDPVGSVTWRFVDAAGRPAPEAGRCYADGRCIAFAPGTAHVQARNANGIAGTMRFDISGSSLGSTLSFDEPVVVHSSKYNQQVRLQVQSADWEYQPVDFYIDGYGAGPLCSRTASMPVNGTQYATCILDRGSNMPAPGDHEIIAVYREPGAGVTTARTTLHVTGALADVHIDEVGENAIAGAAFTVEVSGTDADGESVGLVDEGVTLTMDDGNCDIYSRVCATTRAGTRTITARFGASVATATVEVGAAAMETVAVHGDVTAKAGQPIDLGLTGADRYGNPVADAQRQAELDFSGGSCTAQNVCTATSVYNGALARVFAPGRRHNTPGEHVRVTVTPGAVATLYLQAMMMHEVEVGTPVPISVGATDAWNNTVLNVFDTATLSIDGGTCSTVLGAVTCTPTKAGTRTVTLRDASGVARTVTIEARAGADASLVVTQIGAGPSVAGEPVRFLVEFGDAFGNAKRPLAFGSFSVNDRERVLDCYLDTCTPRTSGEFVIETGFGELRGSTTIRVLPAVVATVSVPTPLAPTLAGAPFTVAITGRDEFGNLATDLADKLDVRVDGGTCSVGATVDGVANATCRTTDAGRRHVRIAGASQGVPVAETTFGLDVLPGDAAKLSVAGPTLLTSGVASAPFTVTATDAFGNDTPVPAAAVIWSIDGLACPSGSCTAGLAGDTAVVAKVGAVEASYGVFVRPGEPTRLLVEGPTSVTSGVPAAYGALGVDAAGNTTGYVEHGVVWTLGDRACPNGICTPGTKGQQIVTAVAGLAQGSLQVTVAPGTPTRYAVTALPGSVTAGDQVDVGITGYDGADNLTGSVTSGVEVVTANGSCQGLVCTPTVRGTATYAAYVDGAYAGSASVTVDPGAAVWLDLTPGEVTVTAGAQTQFAAKLIDAYGNVVRDVSADAGLSTSITEGACVRLLCTTNRVGHPQVTATYGDFESNSVVHVQAGPLDRLTVVGPAFATAGTAFTLDITGYDAHGNPLGDKAAGSVVRENGQLVPCNDGVCTIARAGDHRLVVSSGTATGSVDVEVRRGPLAKLVIAAGDGPFVAGEPIALAVEGFDAHDNSRGDVTAAAALTITGGSCAAIGSPCTTQDAGEQTVTATIAGIPVAQTTVQVEPAALDRLELTGPDGPVRAGSRFTIAANGFDEFDNPIGSRTPVLEIGGVPCATLGCREELVGSYVVTAVDGTVRETISVTVVHAELDEITLSPKTSAITTDETQTYSVVGEDAFTNVVPVATSDVDLSIDGAACRGLVCSSEAPGTYDVVADVDGVTDTASLSVRVGALHSLRLESDAADDTADAGADVRFTATGLDRYGNERGDVTADASFSIAGGSCDDNVCSAESAIDHVVTATIGEDVVGSLTLHVRPAALDHLAVSGPDALVAGEGGDFAAEGFDVFDNSRGDVTDEASFSIDDVRGTCEGSTCTAETAGDRVVSAAIGRARGSATVEVTPAAADHLLVETAASKPAGQAFVVTATEQDEYDNDIADVTGATEFDITGGSCVDNSCVRTSVGSATIAGDHDDVLGSIDVDVVAAPAHGISIEREHDEIVANGTSTSVLTVTVDDEHGNPVLADDIVLDAAPSADAPVIGPVTKVGDGTYTATLRSSTRAGTWTITARDASVATDLRSSTTITQVHDVAAGAAVRLAPATIVADGAATTRASVRVTDVNGNPVHGAVVGIATDGAQRVGSVTEEADGVYAATITAGTVAGTSTIRASVDGTSVTDTTVLTQRAGAVASVAITLAEGELTADGQSRTTATVRLTDANRNAVRDGGPAMITADLGVHVSDVRVDEAGVTTAALTTALTVGTATITAARDGVTSSAKLVLRVRTSPSGTQPVTGAPSRTVLPPVTSSDVAGGATNGGSQLPVTNGSSTKIGVACPSGAIGSCSGTVKITLIGGGTAGAQASATPTSPTGTFTLAPGGSQLVDLPLGAGLLAKLAADPKLQVLVTVTVTDEVGNATTVTSKRTLAMSTFRGVKIAGSVTLDPRGRTAPLRVTCPKTAVGGCSGIVRLNALVDATALRRAGFRTPALGARAFRLRAGATALVQVRVSPLVQRLIATRAAIRVRATAQSRDSVTLDRSTTQRLLVRRAG